MARFSYLFRMEPDDHELLVSLSSRFRDKRETLVRALWALKREVAEREAGSSAGREAIFKRLDAIEEQLRELSQTPAKSRRTSTGYR